MMCLVVPHGCFVGRVILWVVRAREKFWRQKKSGFRAKKMRVRLLEDGEVEDVELLESIRKRRGVGGLLNLDRVLLHAPAVARGWNACFGAIRTGTRAVEGRVREACILYVAVLNGAEYEWQQHEREFLVEGGTRDMMDALRARDTRAPCWSEVERAALALCEEMTRNVTVKEETAQTALRLLGEKGYVELVCIVAGYNMVSRVLVATGVPMESAAGAK